MNTSALDIIESLIGKRNMSDLNQAAYEQVVKKYGVTDPNDPGFIAYVAVELITITELMRKGYRAVEARVIVQVARKEMWRLPLPMLGYEDGCISLTEFLQVAGVERRSAYNLARLAERIMPFCDDHGIPIDDYLNARDYPKLVEAFPHLSRRIDEDAPPDEIQDTLDHIILLPSRQAVRSKYRTKKAGTPLGQGTVNHLTDHSAVMTIRFEHDTDVEPIINKIKGCVEWILVTTMKELSGAVQIQVYDT